MRILFDHNVPKQLRRHLVGHAVRTAKEMSWSRIANGILLQTAEDAGFDLLITADQNLSYQQNLSGRKIALIVLRSNSWKIIRPEIELVITAVNGATTAGFYTIEFERPLRRKQSID